MESSPTTLLPVATSVDAALPATQILQNTGNFAENSGGSTSGLFALLLGQLTIEEPIATPVTEGTGQLLPQLRTELPEQSLPVSGNALPLQLLADTDAEVIDQVMTQAMRPEQVPVLQPLPVMPQPLSNDRGIQVVTRQVTAPLRPEISTITDFEQATRPQIRVQLQSSPEPMAEIRQAPVTDLLAEELPVLQQSTPSTTTTATTTPVMTSIAPAVTATGPAPSTPTTAPQPSYTLQQPVADPQWGSELGQRLLLMNDKGIGRAELRMNPPELGPVEVRISVANDDARVAFQVQHGATREALEQAMPRLREMFASQGLNLSDANVSEQPTQQQAQAGQSGDGSDDDAGDDTFEKMALEEFADDPEQIKQATVDGLIDAYA
ncbi:MAG: flagellar hook-length control protein FliK [Gammaproteobacteria bacterium]|nr:flagellar hook-length control protein FliK [Gammaproteobacteria bacterium]